MSVRKGVSVVFNELRKPMRVARARPMHMPIPPDVLQRSECLPECFPEEWRPYYQGYNTVDVIGFCGCLVAPAVIGNRNALIDASTGLTCLIRTLAWFCFFQCVFKDMFSLTKRAFTKRAFNKRMFYLGFWKANPSLI